MIKKDLLKKYKHVFEQPVTLYENFSFPKRTQLNELFEDIYEVCSSNKSGSREYKYGETNDFEDAKRVARNFAIEDTKLTIYVKNKATQDVEYKVKAIQVNNGFLLRQKPGAPEFIDEDKIDKKVYPNRIKECKETITEEKAVTLFAEAEVFDNYSGPGRIVRYKASGKNHLEAVKKIIDKLGFDITSKDIEKEGYDFEEVLEQIDMLNGEGDAFLINLKDDQGNEFYVHEGYEQDYENLDEAKAFDFDKLNKKLHSNVKLKNESLLKGVSNSEGYKNLNSSRKSLTEAKKDNILDQLDKEDYQLIKSIYPESKMIIVGHPGNKKVFYIDFDRSGGGGYYSTLTQVFPKPQDDWNDEGEEYDEFFEKIPDAGIPKSRKEGEQQELAYVYSKYDRVLVIPKKKWLEIAQGEVPPDIDDTEPEEDEFKPPVEFYYGVYELDNDGDELDHISDFDSEEEAIKFAKKQSFPTHVVFIPSIDPDDDPEIAEYIEYNAPYKAYETIWSSLDESFKKHRALREKANSEGYELVAKGYLLYHPYPTDWDVEDIAEEICANCFNEDYENCDPEISYACYEAAKDYLDNAEDDLEEAKEFNFDKLNKKLHGNIKLKEAKSPKMNNVRRVIKAMDWNKPTFVDPTPSGYRLKWGGHNFLYNTDPLEAQKIIKEIENKTGIKCMLNRGGYLVVPYSDDTDIYEAKSFDFDKINKKLHGNIKL